MTSLKNDEGFTLLELMTVTLILAILVAIAMLSYIVPTNRARAVTCANNQRTFNSGVTLYLASHDAYPQDIDDLRPYVSNFSSAVLCPSGDGTRLSYDTDTRSVECQNHP